MTTRKPISAIVAGLLAVLCLTAFSATRANAQESQNGMETRTPRKMTDRMSAASLMGPIPTNGPWIEFAFTGKNIMATGCSPADPAGPGCAPSSGNNSVFGGAPPWTFNAPAGGVTLKITDAFLNGDQFEVFDNNASLGVTSVPSTSGQCGSDPDICVGDPASSHASFALAPGPHSITIRAVASPFGGGAAYFRIDAQPPGMDHYVCYDVKPGGPFKQRQVVIRNQFEQQKYLVISPRLLCVPSSKRLIQ